MANFDAEIEAILDDASVLVWPIGQAWGVSALLTKSNKRVTPIVNAMPGQKRAGIEESGLSIHGGISVIPDWKWPYNYLDWNCWGPGYRMPARPPKLFVAGWRKTICLNMTRKQFLLTRTLILSISTMQGSNKWLATLNTWTRLLNSITSM